jgi:tetrapyrrole methylase family protein/MazG family protein
VSQRISVVGLGPAGPELITAETAALLEGGAPVWLRTSRHPAAVGLAAAGSFDELYESLGSFEEVYSSIVDRLFTEAAEHGHVVYAVPGSPNVAEHTVELLRAAVGPDGEHGSVTVDVRPAMAFTDLCWTALGVDPMAEAVTIADAHRILTDSAGRLGPMLITQVHSSDVLDDVILALDDVAPETVTILKGLGTASEQVETVTWSELASSLEPDHLTSLWVPQLAKPVAAAFVRFDELVRRLRDECPWDSEQTHESLRPFLLEESYEVLEAIDAVTGGEPDAYVALEEELGDLLFQVFFHSRLAAEQGRFTVADVVDGVHHKLQQRHPHVFGDADPGESVANWEAAKQVEKGRESAVDGIATTLPALSYALKTQRRAAGVGFTGPDLAWALGDVADELAEVTEDPSENEVGDLLFAAVQVARMLKVDPELALRGAANRFTDRFRIVEASAADDGANLAEESLQQLQRRWALAKSQLQGSTSSDT